MRSILGEDLYARTQAHDERTHPDLLASILKPDSGWDVFVAHQNGSVVGFVSLRLDAATRIGEIGLNAVDPAHAGQGIGTAMYDYALERMKEAGMQAAMVGTGADPSHAPARRAYEKAGFEAALPTVWLFRRL